MIDWVTMRWRQAARAVLVERRLRTLVDETAGNSRPMSSSRVQTSFTGRPCAFLAMWAHFDACSRTGSVARRPNEPPANRVSISTEPGGPRSSPAALSWSRVGHLRAEDQLACCRRLRRHAVHRLHGGVGQVGEVVGRLEDLALGRGACGARGVAIAPHCGLAATPFSGGEVVELGRGLVGAARLGLGLVPLDLQRVAALAGGPGGRRRPRRRRWGSRRRRDTPGTFLASAASTTFTLPPKRGAWATMATSACRAGGRPG